MINGSGKLVLPQTHRALNAATKHTSAAVTEHSHNAHGCPALHAAYDGGPLIACWHFNVA